MQEENSKAKENFNENDLTSNKIDPDLDLPNGS